jgi:predicted nuclease of predicted toxin-antitoxin system
MKLLADENFPSPLVSPLQKKRHDVKRILRTAKSASDLGVIELAKKENRIILTFDKDFLEKSNLPVSVMVFDFHSGSLEKIASYLNEVISSINALKKKKNPFIAKYSEDGLEVFSE